MAVMPPDWFDPSYLLAGNVQQQDAYEELRSAQVFTRLAAYDGVLVGTIPIDLATKSSDLDLICEVENLSEFSQLAQAWFGHFEAFSFHYRESRGVTSLVVRFRVINWPIEIFAQPVPVRNQYAFRHMVKEYELLQQHGEKLRSAVLVLKKEGVKTEPAFAQVLGLQGDPYEALLRE